MKIHFGTSRTKGVQLCCFKNLGFQEHRERLACLLQQVLLASFNQSCCPTNFACVPYFLRASLAHLLTVQAWRNIENRCRIVRFLMMGAVVADAVVVVVVVVVVPAQPSMVAHCGSTQSVSDRPVLSFSPPSKLRTEIFPVPQSWFCGVSCQGEFVLQQGFWSTWYSSYTGIMHQEEVDVPRSGWGSFWRRCYYCCWWCCCGYWWW